ncbi:protein FRA10AC1 homolog [Liolophura sinensis]|uniref:protein FRA10AC1 homolog n=1 Tax=Liolophura sinensis TaxID=3198878 RepID=UPI0031586E31
MANRIDLVEIHAGGSYGSEFETDSENERQRSKKESLKGLVSKKKKTTDGVVSKHELEKEYSKEEGRTHRFKILSLDAFSRHKQFVNNYLLYYGGSREDFRRDSSGDKTDFDVIRENHRFLWNEEEDSEDSWEKRLAKKYYDKLFKEYCIADLSRYKENKVGMRWRTEKEVVDGKGQFICGNKKCLETSSLRTWEVNFGYVENQEKKNALVKLRLCPDCSYKLNYHHRRKEVTKQPKTKRKLEGDSEKYFKKPRSESSGREEDAASSSTPDARDAGEASRTQPQQDEANIWKGPAKIQEDKSRDEEFEDYFEGMFL